MTSMRRRYVTSTSLRRHVPLGIWPPLAPPNILNLGPPNIVNLPTPMGSESWFSTEFYNFFSKYQHRAGTERNGILPFILPDTQFITKTIAFMIGWLSDHLQKQSELTDFCFDVQWQKLLMDILSGSTLWSRGRTYIMITYVSKEKNLGSVRVYERWLYNLSVIRFI